jgi:hypothetical protein
MKYRGKVIFMKTAPSLFLLFLILTIIVLTACKSEDENNPVTAANKFLGKWKSENPILVKIKTDFCTNSLEDVATMEWIVNWVVTETENPNVVDIVMSYSSSNFTVVNPNCTFGVGYVPEPQPMYIKGYITDNSITIDYCNEDILTMEYVNNEITGELSYSYCMVYCQEIYTDENDFSVTAY